MAARAYWKGYLERPYYIVPDGKSGEEAFSVIRDAMKDKARFHPHGWSLHWG